MIRKANGRNRHGDQQLIQTRTDHRSEQAIRPSLQENSDYVRIDEARLQHHPRQCRRSRMTLRRPPRLISIVSESHHIARDRYIKQFFEFVAVRTFLSSTSSLSRLSPTLFFFISLIFFFEKLMSSTADDESSPRKGIAAKAQLTSGKSKSTAHNNCGFNSQLAIFSSDCFIIIVSMFRIQDSLFCSCSFFFLFVGKLCLVPPFGSGLISSISIFPQALISGTGGIVSVCCVPRASNCFDCIFQPQQLNRTRCTWIRNHLSALGLISGIS